MGLEEGRVVDDGWQQSREGPEKQGGKELSDDGVLDKQSNKQQSHLPGWTEELLTLTQGLPAVSYVEKLHWLGDVELVHGGDDDGGRGEKKEEDEEDAVDDEAADPPGDSSQ